LDGKTITNHFLGNKKRGSGEECRASLEERSV